MPGVKGQRTHNRKTTEQKRRTGNPGKGRMDDPEWEVEPVFVQDSIPEPARPLGTNGRQTWDQVWNLAPWLTETDAPTLLWVCEQEDELALYRTRWANAMERQEDWNTVIAPLANRMDKIRKQLFSGYRELGLSPIGRSILGVAEAKITDRLSRLYGDQYKAPIGEEKRMIG